MLIAAVSALASYGYSQTTLGKEVTRELFEVKQELVKIASQADFAERKVDVERSRVDLRFSDHTRQTDDRILAVAKLLDGNTSLVAAVIRQNQELIELVKVQNQLLQRTMKP